MTTCLGLGLFATPASANAQSLEVSGAYSFLYVIGEGSNYNTGWLASVGSDVNSWFGVAGEVGCNYTSLEASGLKFSLCNFMGGPKVASRQNGAISPLAQLGFGGIRHTLTTPSISKSDHRFAWQAGGGVDLNLSPRAGVRVQGDYRFLPIDGHWLGFKEFRFATGMVVRFAN